MFDLTSYQTFNLLTKWLESIDEKVETKIDRIIIGNKTDMVDKI